MMRLWISFSKPFITARTTTSAITPTATPATEMNVMMEMNLVLRLALR